MLSKCANPRCGAEFRSQSGGELLPVRRELTAGDVEWHWLCATCARTMTLVADDEKVKIIPRATTANKAKATHA